jgi:hypothetical protein
VYTFDIRISHWRWVCGHSSYGKVVATGDEGGAWGVGDPAVFRWTESGADESWSGTCEILPEPITGSGVPASGVGAHVCAGAGTIEAHVSLLRWRGEAVGVGDPGVGHMSSAGDASA